MPFCSTVERCVCVSEVWMAWTQCQVTLRFGQGLGLVQMTAIKRYVKPVGFFLTVLFSRGKISRSSYASDTVTKLRTSVSRRVSTYALPSELRWTGRAEFTGNPRPVPEGSD
jgi:hypothetical protein